MDAAKVELLRALGQLVRGLSALFWGLPVALFIDVETARTDWFGFLGDAAFVPAVLAGGPLYFPPDALLTNNYPPLSFYLVAPLAGLIGDAVFAGRLMAWLASWLVPVGNSSVRPVSTSRQAWTLRGSPTSE